MQGLLSLFTKEETDALKATMLVQGHGVRTQQCQDGPGLS